MCHDIGHPGTNNAFQVNTLSELAITYNDKAVLENYHCSTTFQMFQQPELNILVRTAQARLQHSQSIAYSFLRYISIPPPPPNPHCIIPLTRCVVWLSSAFRKDSRTKSTTRFAS